MRFTLFLVSLFGLALPLSTLAAWEPVLPYGTLCDTKDRVCLHVRIDFERNKKIIEIHGQLYKTAGPGVLTFEFTGETPQQEYVFHPTAIEVQGQYNEGISHQFGPPFSNRTDWSLYRLTFTPSKSE